MSAHYLPGTTLRAAYHPERGVEYDHERQRRMREAHERVMVRHGEAFRRLAAAGD